MAQQQSYNPYYGQQPPFGQQPPYGQQAPPYQGYPPPPDSQVPPYGFQQPPQPPPFMPPPPNAGYAGGDPEANYIKESSLGFSNASIRAAFVRKVFTLLTIMLSIVAGLIALFIFHEGTKKYVQTHSWLYFLSYGVFLVTYISMVCCESVRRNYPGNIICLLLLTLSMGYMTAMISSFYNVNIVFLAALICTICCGSIMLFACQTKYDFTSCFGVMFVISMVLFIFGIVAIIAVVVFKVLWMYMIYAGLSALVFMVYLAIDTQMVIGGKRHEYSPEDYIMAATQLFLDIIYIFIYLLQIIGYFTKN